MIINKQNASKFKFYIHIHVHEQTELVFLHAFHKLTKILH